MTPREKLRARLLRLEAIVARPGTPGEREAAVRARAIVRKQLSALEPDPRPPPTAEPDFSGDSLFSDDPPAVAQVIALCQAWLAGRRTAAWVHEWATELEGRVVFPNDAAQDDGTRVGEVVLQLAGAMPSSLTHADAHAAVAYLATAPESRAAAFIAWCEHWQSRAAAARPTRSR